MEISSVVNAALAIKQMQLQNTAAMKVMSKTMEEQPRGINLLLESLGQMQDNMPSVASDVGRYFDVSI